MHFCPGSSKIVRQRKDSLVKDTKTVYVVLYRETGEATFGTGSVMDLCLIRDNAAKAIRALVGSNERSSA